MRWNLLLIPALLSLVLLFCSCPSNDDPDTGIPDQTRGPGADNSTDSTDDILEGE